MPKSNDNMLALTWQPAFCEYLPEKPECARLNGGGSQEAAKRLSLHGLWPQPRGKDYCGVVPSVVATDKKGQWGNLPAPLLDPETDAALQKAMPGFESDLHRHEWIKHGTCYHAAGGADAYFDDSLYLLNAVNGSVVGDFLAEHVGKMVRAGAIRAMFDQAFGVGAGDRVSIICKKDGGRSLIQEIRIGLRGHIAPEVPVRENILAAMPVDVGCRQGVIDPAGLQ